VRFAVVTVIHDSAEDLGRMLTSVERFLRPPPAVVVVNSGSRDAGAEVARRHGAEVVELPGNLGFGAGCNAGLERVTEPVTVLLNPDVELLDPGLIELVRRAEGVEALLAPRLLDADGMPQDSAHPRPGTVEALLPAVFPRSVLPRPLRHRYEPWRRTTVRTVGWVIAAALVARTDVLRRLGPFDPNAFLFYEDMDLCLRASDAGVPTVLVPQVALRHRTGGSTRRAFADDALEPRARRRREVVARGGRGALLLDDAAQALTFSTRAAGRGLLRRGGGRERAQLRALAAARREPTS
jgi:GT2 family glycosyltransferase